MCFSIELAVHRNVGWFNNGMGSSVNREHPFTHWWNASMPLPLEEASSAGRGAFACSAACWTSWPNQRRRSPYRIRATERNRWLRTADRDDGDYGYVAAGVAVRVDAGRCRCRTACRSRHSALGNACRNRRIRWICWPNRCCWYSDAPMWTRSDANCCADVADVDAADDVGGGGAAAAVAAGVIDSRTDVGRLHGFVPIPGRGTWTAAIRWWKTRLATTNSTMTSDSCHSNR